MSISNNKTHEIMYCWVERVFLFFLALYLVKSAQYMTTFNLSPFVPAWADRFLLISLLVITVLKLLLLLLSDLRFQKKWYRLLLCGLPVSLIWFLVYVNDQFIFLALFSILILGSIGTDYRTLLKVEVCTVGAVVLSAGLCSMGGVIENRVYWGHETVRSSFGYTYPTNMAACYLFLSIAAWVAWDDIWDPVFLLPGLLSLFSSSIIADSRTCFLCSVLFLLSVLWCWLVKKKSKKYPVKQIQKVIGFFSRITFPLCAILAVVLTIAYHEESPFALKINEWTSTRLALQADALFRYGLHLFGSPFEMRGVASVFPILDLNYVDCSYIQLLLRYGILPFLVYLFLWPCMTDVAAKAGKHRLVIGLALIALHALSEQHFLLLDYNILLVAPFSVLSLTASSESINRLLFSEKQRAATAHSAVFGTVVVMTLPVLLFGTSLLSGFRTLATVLRSPNLTLQLYQRREGFLGSIGFLVAGVLIFFLIYKIIADILSLKKPKLWRIALLSLCLFAGSFIMIKGNARIDRAMEEYETELKEDQTIISLIKTLDDVRLYETDLPTLYERIYGGTSASFFNGEDLARFHNIAVITKSNNNWPCMFRSGFSYAEISEHHAVYTDSRILIDKLITAGYSPVPYFSKEMSVNMVSLAEWNQLTLEANGSIIFSKDYPIMNVPDVDLRRGQYTFCFDLSLLGTADLDDEDTCLLLRFTDNSGARQLFEQSVDYDQFDSGGHLNLQVTSWFDAAGVEFNLIPQDGVIFELRSVTYRIIS